MTVKEILLKAKSEELKFELSYIQDFNVCNCGDHDLYLDMYKKAFRKNAAYKYLKIKNLLDQDAAVVEINCGNLKIYPIFTKRTFKGQFSKPLKDNEKIILE